MRVSVRMSWVCQVLVLAFVTACSAYGAETLDLSRAVVAAPDDHPVVATASRMLREEIAKRTGIMLEAVSEQPGDSGPVVVLCRQVRILSAL